MLTHKSARFAALLVASFVASVAYVMLRGTSGESVPRSSPDVAGVRHASDETVRHLPISVSESSTSTAREVTEARDVTEESGGRIVAEAPRIAPDSMAEADRERFDRVNAILARAGLKQIRRDAGVSAEDLETFRSVVDSANRSCSQALNRWRAVADEGLVKLKDDLMDRLARGETEGLPLESADNSMKRRHRYEAVSLVMHEGRNYVLRVPVESAPNLLQSGTEIEEQDRHRLSMFDSVVRELFH